MVRSVGADTCEYQPACPGCSRFGAPGLSAPPVQRLGDLAERFSSDGQSVRLEEVPFSGQGFRHRVRLSVRGAQGNVGVGIFERGSHRLISIPRCVVHHPSIRAFLPRFIELLNRTNVSPYDESCHAGMLRAIQLVVQRSSAKLQVVLLVRDDLVTGAPEELSNLVAHLEGDDAVHSLFLGALPRKTNSLFAERYLHVSGPKALDEECAGARNFYPPGAFGQANPELHERAVERIKTLVPEGSSVVEFYAGVGSIGLALSARGDVLKFNEVGEGSIEGLRLGWAEQHGFAMLPLCPGRAGEQAQLYEQDDVVVVDPPRKGLDPPLLERLVVEAPRRLVYLSCGLDALLREANHFRESGHYRLSHLSAWAYFPFTDHVETLMMLDRLG